MQYSPKLKKAMEDIKTILKENDIAGVVLLHTPGFSEYLNHLGTSYSCASIAPEGVRLKLKEAEVGRERAKQIAGDTYNMITHIEHHLSSHSMMFTACHKLLKEKWNTIDYPGSHTGHNQQNN